MENPGFNHRWVFFPKLIEISRKTYSAPTPCTGLHCTGLPADEADCVGEVETVTNVCSLVPKLNDEGNPELAWAVRTYQLFNAITSRSCLEQLILPLFKKKKMASMHLPFPFAQSLLA